MTPVQRLGDPLPAMRLVVDRVHQDGSRHVGQFGQDAEELAVKVARPVLLALDPAGATAGVPAVLMSRLPGRVDWWPSDMDRWLRRLARLLPRIHAAPLPPVGVLRPFAPYPQASYRPPG